MLKQNKSLVVGFCLSALAVSCSQSEPDKESERKKSDGKLIESADETYIDTNKRVTKNGLKKNIEQLSVLGKKTISFNGGKYLFDGKKLRKGSQVRHVNMSESGRVKGSFVVVTKAGGTLGVSFKSKTKIAKNTFRIIPAQTDDLMTVYKELLSNQSITLVELEVVYSGKESGALEY